MDGSKVRQDIDNVSFGVIAFWLVVGLVVLAWGLILQGVAGAALACAGGGVALVSVVTWRAKQARERFREPR